MPYLLNKRLCKMTEHEDLGLNKMGKREFRCKTTGDIRGYSKNKMKQIRASREKSKENELKEMEGDVRGISSDNVQNLKNFLDERSSQNSTPNVTETRNN